MHRCPNTQEVVLTAHPKQNADGTGADATLDGQIVAVPDTADATGLAGDLPTQAVVRPTPGFKGVVGVTVRGDADPTAAERFIEERMEIEFHDPEAQFLGVTAENRPIAIP